MFFRRIVARGIKITVCSIDGLSLFCFVSTCCFFFIFSFSFDQCFCRLEAINVSFLLGSRQRRNGRWNSWTLVVFIGIEFNLSSVREWILDDGVASVERILFLFLLKIYIYLFSLH